MTSIIAPSRAKSIGELRRFIMHRARHKAEMAERNIEGPNTYPELRSRVAAYGGETMIQQSYAHMDIGVVKGEPEGSDDQIDELRGTRKTRRDERSTHQRGPGKQPRKAPPSGRHEKQTTGRIA